MVFLSIPYTKQFEIKTPKDIGNSTPAFGSMPEMRQPRLLINQIRDFCGLPSRVSAAR